MFLVQVVARLLGLLSSPVPTVAVVCLAPVAQAIFGAHPLSRLLFVDRLCLLWDLALAATSASNDSAKITKHLAQLHVDMYSA